MNFSIDELVRKYMDMDYYEIIVELEKDLQWLENANWKRLAEAHRTDESSISCYHSACMNLSAAVNGNMNKVNCRKEFKVIFENLVTKQQLDPSALGYFS